MNQICSQCVMDETSRVITFDSQGRCNYCSEFVDRAGQALALASADRARQLTALVEAIRAQGRGKRYDCIMGLSGGVDSSYAIVQAVNLGLRPLAVHMDNGWNSELAQNNIENLVRGLDLDLVTYVIDWREYRSLMEAFFAADVIDIELLYDNAMYAVNYRQAKRWGTKWILAGTNLATEGMRIPAEWNWLKYDKRNIKAIHRYQGGRTLNSFPAIGTLEYVWNLGVRRVKWVSFLDYFNYNKAQAIQELQRDFAFKPYPHKHYESVFTRLYMGFILPTKFNVDMRKVDFSNLIISGQMTREEALLELQKDPYPSPQDLRRDITFFRKKLGWSETDWQSYLARPERRHNSFASEERRYAFIRNISRRLRVTSESP